MLSVCCFVCFYGLDMYLYRILNVRRICSTYLSGHALHFNWHTLLWLFVTVVPSLGFMWFLMVLVVLNAIFMLMFLNNFVMIVLVSGS
jgi:hypothetical protein